MRYTYQKRNFYGQDHILYRGQELPLAQANDRASVSSLGNEPVIFELFAA